MSLKEKWDDFVYRIPYIMELIFEFVYYIIIPLLFIIALIKYIIK